MPYPYKQVKHPFLMCPYTSDPKKCPRFTGSKDHCHWFKKGVFCLLRKEEHEETE